MYPPLKKSCVPFPVSSVFGIHVISTLANSQARFTS